MIFVIKKLKIIILFCFVLLFVQLFLPYYKLAKTIQGANSSVIIDTQEDWELGTSNNLDTVSTPGSIKISQDLSIGWGSRASLPYPWAWSASATDESYLYIAGGYIDTGGGFDVSTEAAKYDPDTNSWSLISNLNYSRAYHCAASAVGNVYVMGGKDLFHTNDVLDSVEMYDSGSDNWVVKSSMNDIRWRHACGSYNDKIYVFGQGSIIL
ncbi:MAG TPA: hypothetical protein PLE96_02660 [bacterium]|nr:hypothetical protein [bacterium]